MAGAGVGVWGIYQWVTAQGELGRLEREGERAGYVSVTPVRGGAAATLAFAFYPRPGGTPSTRNTAAGGHRTSPAGGGTGAEQQDLPDPQARPAGGELPRHRRAVGPHRPVLRSVLRGTRHGVGRPAEAQPVPGVEPLLRRQPRTRPGAEDRVRAAVHVRAAAAGKGAAGPAQGRAAPRPGAGRLPTGSGGASAPARSTTR